MAVDVREATLSVLCLLLIALIGAGDLSVYAQPQRVVDAGGGRRFNLFCTGTGAPTLILVSGLGLKYTGTLVWYKVQPSVAKFARVCSFDCAGLGSSDPGPFPRNATRNASDLRLLLQSGGIKPPYILVAHSLGGFDARLFRDRHPSEVVAMVIVDPTVERFTGALERGDKSERAFYAQVRACAREAQTGSLHERDTHRQCIGPNRSGAIITDDTSLGSDVNDALDRILQSPTPWNTFLSEAQSAGFITGNARTDDRAIAANDRTCGAMPLIVLTAGNTYSGNDQRQWSAKHASIAARSTRGANCLVPNSDHFIQIDRPKGVVAAVREAVALTKSRDAPNCGNISK